MRNLLTAIVFALFLTSLSAADRVYELRTYYTNPGKLDALHARFKDHTMALFEKHGIKNIGYWVPEENKDGVLIYLISHASRDAAAASWKAFMADEDWKSAYKASIADGRLVKKIENVYLKTTEYSPDIQTSKTDDARLFELRTYTTREDRLKNLNARFQNHTVGLFKKHGLSQLGYWTPTDEDKGRDTQLIYLLAHKNKAARDEGFAAFGKDPAWKAARAASVADGPILVKKGVKAQFLKPTEYSPTR